MGHDERRRIALLDEDPGLGVRLAPDERVAARAAVHAETIVLRRGDHGVVPVRERELLITIVLDGWMLRSTTVAGRTAAILVGRGSIGRPGDGFGYGGILPHSIAWTVVETSRVALIDGAALSALSRWPGLTYTVLRRSFERSYLVTLMASIRALQHVELRLRAFMWLYAGRYGRAVDGGTHLPVRLSHQQLADLVGSQRPSVSAHLAALAAGNEIVRCPDRTWLLRGQAPSVLDDLCVRGEGPGPLLL